jgi:hypothetical protein
MDGWTDGRTDGQAGRQTGRQADRQTDRQIVYEIPSNTAVSNCANFTIIYLSSLILAKRAETCCALKKVHRISIVLYSCL